MSLTCYCNNLSDAEYAAMDYITPYDDFSDADYVAMIGIIRTANVAEYAVKKGITFASALSKSFDCGHAFILHHISEWICDRPLEEEECENDEYEPG